ncbi:hypothetical protein WH50_12830 [Pokkaliibacter plantistimulans]|uniref:Uncharacterized protein n=1 Tax=Pokkaliibacter plantistimulans TaxID=1635171 RepID=A0ABX5LW54_9GAMM|nr:hypothetical protein [Pokkaliibacter plantistimulans]PXF30889.1 hypothetical protein WH50_12830 [Pokkaliibacter plantistimulans]
MNDIFINRLFSETFEKMGIQLDPDNIGSEYQLLIDDQYPVLMRYDPINERVLLVSNVDTSQVSDKLLPVVTNRLLQAGLNPLMASGPGAGRDEKSGLFFCYTTLPRHDINADKVCQEMIKLVEWSKQAVVA